MLKAQTLILICAVTLTSSCASKAPKQPEQSPCHQLSPERYAFVGSWEGVHSEPPNRQRRWIQNRFCDGTYSLQLYEFEDGYLVDFGQEVGRWWLKGNVFFEQGHSWPLSEVHQYRFQILGPRQGILFKRQDGYSFTDQKINPIERPLYPQPTKQAPEETNSI